MKIAFKIVLLAGLLHCAPAFAGVPSVSQMEVADVTPGSFAVSWVASEPSVGTITTFASDCTTALAGLSLAAENNDATGFIKVTVSGLSADSSYCYQTRTTSISTLETALYPSAPAPLATTKAALRTMMTGTALLPFANDLLRVPPVYLAAETEVPDGILAIMYLDGGNGPLSLLLTNDGRTRFFNMNNLFSSATGSTMNLVGGERVRITERHGKSGCVVDRFRQVPADQETTRARDFVPSPRPQDIDFNGTVNILDVLRVAGGMGTARGDSCFNSELDMSSHDRVDQSDLDSVIGSFDATP
jgi:hypothetical protein